MRRKIPSTISSLLLLPLLLAAAGCSSLPASGPASKAANPEVILATTTSTQDSGLLDVLLPLFEQQTGFKVKPVAVGTGAALALGEQGDADVLLVHAPSSEKKLVDNKTVINYRLVMHNDFILVGPPSDPAGVKSTPTAAKALQAIAEHESLFLSRGDDSGTDKMEKSLWIKAGITQLGQWYQETGSGMGQTLSVASEKEGYTLTDRATYLATRKNLNLDIVLEGDPSLLNIYHVMQVNPELFPEVNAAGAQAFVDFLVAPETQEIIGEFGRDKYGQPLFFPDAGKKMENLNKSQEDSSNLWN